MAAAGSANAQATQTVIITGHYQQSSPAFDSWATQYFPGPAGDSFSFPEGEALASIFGPWIQKKVTPKAAMTIDVCSMSKSTPASRAVTKNSEDAERWAAANQIFYGSLPNFVNTKKDGLIVAIVFSDGSQEIYRHTTMSGLQPVSGTYIPGTGVSNCAG